MKVVKATIVSTEYHHLSIDVPDDCTDDECRDAIWEEFQANNCRKPQDWDTSIYDFEILENP